MKDVDGIFVNYMGEEGSVQVADYLGTTEPRYADSSDLGGAAFEAFVHHAMMAIVNERCEVALVTYASRQRSQRSRAMSAPQGRLTIAAQFQSPYGLFIQTGRIKARFKLMTHAKPGRECEDDDGRRDPQCSGSTPEG